MQVCYASGRTRSRRFSVAAALFAVVLLIGVFARPLQAAMIISYGGSGDIPPGITFSNVFESSGTDPVPLYGPPSFFATGMDFDPMTFVSSATGGAQDITDGQLNFTVGDTPGGSLIGINTISLFESGDYSLLGTGTAATQALAGAIIRVTVTEINGAPVAPINLSPSNASVGFNLLSNPGIVQPWSLGTTINVDSQLPAGQDATRVEVSINNQLATLSQSTSAAFIAKKEFIVNLGTFTSDVPEPAGLALLALAMTAACLPRGRRV
jgi:hypothetical protein